MRILIVDDHRLFADGLGKVLESWLEAVEVTVCTDASAAIAEFAGGAPFALAFVDLNLPGIGGLELLRALQARRILVPVIVVSGTTNQRDVQRAFDHGALGFIPKSSNADTVIKGVRRVLAGELFLPDELWPQVDLVNERQTAVAARPAGDVEAIGPRQLEVLELMRQGFTNRQIAEVLAISESTVKTHVGVLFRALSVKSRTACVRAAIEQRLIA